MRTLFALLLLATAAHAQVLAVSFKDEKVAAKFKDRLVTIGNSKVLVGEGKYNIYSKEGSPTYETNGKLEMWVADPNDPGFVPYKLKNDERIPANPKAVVEFPGASVKAMSVLIRDQSLSGLALEYRERMAEIQELTTERDQAAKGSPEWFMAHQRLLSNFERLHNWMSSTCYPVAAKKLEKEIERQRKSVAANAIAERLSKAKESIKLVDTSETVVAAAKAAVGDALTFKVQESLHMRIVYRQELSDERIHALLEFGEEVIDGFRGDCIDPYVGVDFKDTIPEKMFAEFCFGPTEFAESEVFVKQYYGIVDTKNVEERKNMVGASFRRARAPESIHYYRWNETEDLEGIIAHGLGHDLTGVQYNGSITRDLRQDWLVEGVGFYLSLEFLGRNSVSCREFKESRYVHEKKKGAERAAEMGMRDYFNSLALDSGPTIDQLAQKELFDLTDADLAKSWSFYDFVVKKEGRQGQRFLQAACELAKDKPTFLQKWRDRCLILFEGTQGDLLKAIDTRWRSYAETGQETGETGRRK